MEQTVSFKKRGNPNFGKKTLTPDEQFAQKQQSIEDADFNRQYIFQLTTEHKTAKPRSAKQGDMGSGEVISAFQPFYGVCNNGIAWDPDYISPQEAKKDKKDQKKGGQRRWRYLANFPSIWVDEQVEPEPTSEELAAAENDLTFRRGVLRVFGYQKTKLQALMLNNSFEGVKRPLKNVPKDYKLLDQDKIDQEVLQSLDDSFEAEKSARAATNEEMYAVGYYFGIDATKSDDAFRKAFIMKARENPSVFNREFTNPKNKFKYNFLNALADNIISGTVLQGKCTLISTGAHLFDIQNTATDLIADELATMVMTNYEKAVGLHNRIEKIYLDGEE